MFEFLEALLALFGLVCLVGLWAVWRDGPFDEPGEPGAPDPYRAALEASARMSALGWEAERLMFEAAERSKDEE